MKATPSRVKLRIPGSAAVCQTSRKVIRAFRRMRDRYILKRFVDERARLIDLYLVVTQNCLTNRVYEDPPLQVLGQMQFDPLLREYGWDWPSVAHTMIGSKRMANLRMLLENVIRRETPGDLIETGVWRGGACIYMRAILKAYNVTDRRVWAADSFEGLPPPNPALYPADHGDTFSTYSELAVSLDQVKQNFAKYDLLDEQVVFLKGWFKDTLPTAPIESLAILRLDADMYESTTDSLRYLYDKLSVGGFVIVDDYHVVEGCRKAVDDFRASRNIIDTIDEIDGVGVFWQKSGA